MKLLAIDTTETACSAALNINGEVRGQCKIAPRQHSELILPMMDQLLAEAGLKPGQLDALAFGRGPGSFTGVRIAAAVIQGVAFAADLPVVAVSSLGALAQGAWRLHQVEQVFAAFDARMQEVYWGAYQLSNQGVMRLYGEEQVILPEHIVVPNAAGWVGVGSGWLAYPDLSLINNMFAGLQVDAIDVASIGIADIEHAVPAEHALPVYLRNNVARKKAY